MTFAFLAYERVTTAAVAFRAYEPETKPAERGGEYKQD